ncbi:sulfotransferase [Sphingomonas ginsenosidivorax]|uniref:Sulfotransferase n=1 Tax=Sphingomonas ginsenosidivorax TaxID=862135 RepID=A0A5C6UEF0_9SPHN|nr:sulfotransferase [Sphingomonas ginsenosidivorax]TXC71069.1 sulfotransferase [Sphingomonas ginsenosidivorax]
MTYEARVSAAEKALERGDIAQAAGLAAALSNERPDLSDGGYLLGLVEAASGRISRALPLVERAVAQSPTPQRLSQYARLLSQGRRDGEAGRTARTALALDPQDALSLDTIGCVLARLGDHEGSIVPFKGAVARAGDDIGFRYNLAAACGFTGRIAEAREHYEALLSRAPNYARAHYALAILRRNDATDNHVDRLREVLAGTTDPLDLMRLRYALAKELEDLGRHDEAYAELATANAARKRDLGYDFAIDASLFDALEAGFSTDVLAGTGLADAAPIFVIGMPRTGTTLVDRILSSHPDVGSAGELQAMPLAVKELARTPSRVVVDAATIHASLAADPRELGERYMARATPHRPAGTARFVDKLPANILYAGHIARALPHARIVCLRRNPMDTVWSNFKNLFAPGSPYYFYSNDLMDTARYYARFDRLMAFWQRRFPGRILELSYEALVADQEGETRRLLAHCGLGWDASTLAFHENKAAVATPSAAQVRRPINADAVGRWRVHADAMGPVRRFFEANGIVVD